MFGVCPLLFACYVLRIARSLMCVDCCAVFAALCLSCAVFVLLVANRLFVVCCVVCLLFVVCWLLVVCCLVTTVKC